MIDTHSPAPDSPHATTSRGWRHWTWRIVRVPVIAYLGAVLLLPWLENSLIFFPSKYPDGEWQPSGLQYEDANFAAADGVKLHGWYVPAEDPIAVVLFCHGNGGNLTHREDVMRAMQRYVGATILVFDYRGYGRSEGSPSEQGVLSDARAARAWLAQRAGIAEQDIVLMGESLGGAVAVDLAAHNGARALVLENTFTSLPDMAAVHYPWLPARWLMRSRLDSLAKISQYHGPLLMAHGDADSIVPYALGEQLFAAANEPKQWVREPGIDHNDPRSPQFYDQLRQFLAALPAR